MPARRRLELPGDGGRVNAAYAASGPLRLGVAAATARHSVSVVMSRRPRPSAERGGVDELVPPVLTGDDLGNRSDRSRRCPRSCRPRTEQDSRPPRPGRRIRNQGTRGETSLSGSPTAVLRRLAGCRTCRWTSCTAGSARDRIEEPQRTARGDGARPVPAETACARAITRRVAALSTPRCAPALPAASPAVPRGRAAAVPGQHGASSVEAPRAPIRTDTRAPNRARTSAHGTRARACANNTPSPSPPRRSLTTRPRCGAEAENA